MYQIDSRVVEVDVDEYGKAKVTEWVIRHRSSVYNPMKPDGWLEVFSSFDMEVAEDFLFAMRMGRGMRSV